MLGAAAANASAPASAATAPRELRIIDFWPTPRLFTRLTAAPPEGAALAPYLARLGISHVYASPIFAARPGSTHGYDVTDPNRVNPELGGEAEFRRA